MLIAPDPEDRTGEATIDIPFLEKVVLEYAERMPNPNDPLTTSVGGQGGMAGAGAGGFGGGAIAGGGMFGMGGGGSSKGGRKPAQATGGAGGVKR